MGVNFVVVLAAGRGTRAGGPKALHLVNARPWWEIQREKLARVRLREVWVVSERVKVELMKSRNAPERMAVADESAPMITSVLTGLREVQRLVAEVGNPSFFARGVFILPVDVPVPDQRVFVELLGASGFGVQSPNRAAIPSHAGKRGHPLYLSWALVSERLLGVTLGADPRLDRLIEDVRVEVPVSDPTVVVNLNTGAEFEAWARVNAGT